MVVGDKLVGVLCGGGGGRPQGCVLPVQFLSSPAVFLPLLLPKLGQK